MSRTRGAARPRKINGYWYLVRRVPKPFQHIEARRVVMLSTHIRGIAQHVFAGRCLITSKNCTLNGKTARTFIADDRRVGLD
jgi:hypothetical protein